MTTTKEFKLYCFAQSGNAYKAALMLNLCGAKWEPRFVDFFGGETRTPEYRAINEMGEVPVLEHGAKRLSQSGVILDLHLSKTAFVAGPQPTIADLSICGYLYWPDEFGVSWSDYPRIGAWLERIRALPGWVHPYELMPGHPLKR